MSFGKRLRAGYDADPQTGQITRIRPQLFNAAFPELVVPQVKPGERVTVRGVDPRGPLSFRVPTSPLRFTLRLGDEIVQSSLNVDQIGIETKPRRIFIAYRYAFRYRLNPLQLRSCVLEHVDSIAMSSIS